MYISASLHVDTNTRVLFLKRS